MRETRFGQDKPLRRLDDLERETQTEAWVHPVLIVRTFAAHGCEQVSAFNPAPAEHDAVDVASRANVLIRVAFNDDQIG